MRILVFQHIAVEHPGILRDFMAADGVAWDAVELDEGARIPSLDGYDALLVMGGPMDVWQEDAHPWLKAEKAVIREAVRQRRMPYLGICLGHQLLADALGGRVGSMARSEVGILDVALTDAATEDPLFAGLDRRSQALQWHSAEVQALPADSVVLASSELCPVQAFRTGDLAWGIQYHVELTSETVTDWGCIPEYERALETSLGPGALQKLNQEAATQMPAFNHSARALYDNFAALVRERPR